MSMTPLIMGSGRAGHAIANSLAILNLRRPDLEIAPAVWLKRNGSLAEERQKFKNAILCIANPHGLHARSILEAEHCSFDAIFCEKPACVNLEQLTQLRAIQTPTAVLHVYRQTWGIQTLRQMMLDQIFGEIITIEGRYWQSSTADRALQVLNEPSKVAEKAWKDDTNLSGEFDTYLDVGTHWVDAVSFLVGDTPLNISGWRSFVNAQSAHRDSHIQLTIQYPKTRAFGSISKTYHGATNHFEINVIGSKLSATWEFLRPDEIRIGEGRDRRVLTRKHARYGSQLPPHHGTGWLEGYIEIASQVFDELAGKADSDYPRLKTNLPTLEAILKVQWQN